MRLVVRTEDQARACATTLARLFVQHRERGLLVSIEPYRPPKTLAQNAKIHAMLAEMADALGYSKDELEEAVLHQYGPRKTVSGPMCAVSVPKHISELSRDEASALIEKIIYQAAECGVTLRSE